eukprot:6104722-Prymnesium_polylepis.1
MHSPPFVQLLHAYTGRAPTRCASEVRRFRAGLDYTLAHVGTLRDSEVLEVCQRRGPTHTQRAAPTTASWFVRPTTSATPLARLLVWPTHTLRCGRAFGQSLSAWPTHTPHSGRPALRLLYSSAVLLSDGRPLPVLHVLAGVVLLCGWRRGRG